MSNRAFDQASQLEQSERDRAIQAHEEMMLPWRDKTVADSATHCCICHERIPQKRREAWPGVQTCCLCQDELDKAINQHR